jgi:glucose/mannose transport system permease protein
MKSKSTSLKIIVAIVLVALTCAYVMPVYVMITTSLKTPAEINQRDYLSITKNPQFNNYPEVLFGGERFRTPMWPALINSSVVSISVTLLACFFGGLSGYYLSRTKTKFAQTLFILVGIALYMPYQAVIIPLVVLTARARMSFMQLGPLLAPLISGIQNVIAGSESNLTRLAMIVSYLILNLPFATVLMGTFFLSVPKELEEAAEVDGASRVATFFKVVVPTSLPAYASVGIIIFTQVWNEFFLALTLASQSTRTVQLVMAETKGTTVVYYDLQMAAALLTVAVPLLIFLLLGRYFVRGILAGALKG